MTVSVLVGPAEVLLTRRALTGPVEGEDIAREAQRMVRSAGTIFELVVENAERGRTVDGWLAPDGLVWHVRGDLDTPRTAVVVPPAHLGATVAAMVGLGERRAPGSGLVEVPVAALRAQLAGPGHAGLPGGVYRVWSLHWSGERSGRMTLVDQGADGGLWMVDAVLGKKVSLSPVTPLETWTRLCGLLAVVRGQPPGS